MLNSTSEIVHVTHCSQNCVRYKYELAKKMDWNVNVGNPSKDHILQSTLYILLQNFLKSLALIIKWLDKELSLETEALAYDSLTFVANFGGTLGLFVGFSFYMLWDLILPVFERCKQMFKLK